MKVERLGDLDCLVRRGASPKACVFFHGYGAGMDDLAPIAEALDTDRDWYFPDGPFVSEGGGRAWFPIASDLFGRCLMAGDFRGLLEDGSCRDGFDLARRRAGGLFARLGGRYGSVAVGGFSQGSLVALDIGLRYADRVERLALMSGLFVSRQLWRGYDGCPAWTFQCHGREDSVVPFAEGRRLCDFLSSLNAGHRFFAFEGGHGIPPSALAELGGFLEG